MVGRKPNVWKDTNRFSDGFRILQGEQEYVTYPEHSSIRIWTSEEAESYTRHNHAAVEIIWTLRGEVDVETLNQSYRINQRSCQAVCVNAKSTKRKLLLLGVPAAISVKVEGGDFSSYTDARKILPGLDRAIQI